MMRPRLLVAAVAFLVLSTAVRAQEPIRFARTPDISPDGKLVAFSYLGDIWVVEAIGGVARPVTMHTAHDVYPVFSPDGRSIAFTSNRHGSYDVFTVAAQGGKPKRITTDSASDIVNGWSPDGKQLLFSSSRSTDFPPTFELYSVSTEGGQPRRITHGDGREGVFSPKGDQIAYVRGPGTWYRKGYRGSANDDVWICNADGSHNRQLTTCECQDTSPMWSPDGQTIYYVSECAGGPANLMKLDAAGKDPPVQISFHKDDAVRKARISANGAWIVYECGPDLWVVSTQLSSTPRKLAIEVHADDKENTESTVTLTRGASEFALSPDEKHLALVVHGELFLQPVTGGAAARRLTDHPAFDHGLAWAPDSSKLIFASDRGGQEDLYLLEADDSEHPKFVEATKFKTTRLTNTPEAELGVQFAPDGKRVGFLRSGRLLTMNPDGSDQKVIVDKVQVVDFEWSPDSKWLAYSRQDGSFASEVYILPATGGESKNVTRYATYNAGITWSERGMKLGFISQRRSTTGMFVLSLQKPAAPNTPATSDIDWDDIHTRVQQPAMQEADEGAISPDGTRVAFRSTANSGDDLWVASTSGGHVTRLTNSFAQPRQIQWSKRFTDTIYFRDRDGQFRTLRIGSGEGTAIAYRAKMTIRRDEEFGEMFEQSWRALADYFYDPLFHGVNWNSVRDKYRPLVKHVALKEDLYTLVSLMLGELNASHLGIGGFGKAPDEVTADLGLLYDEKYRGPGLKIAEILKNGPADRRGLNLKAGDLIQAIDGVELNEKVELSKLLNDKIGQNLTLTVTSNPADAKAARKVDVQGIRRSSLRPNEVNAADLMYERWVARNADAVAKMSNGRLGYIHIPNMEEPGLDRFLRSLYSDVFDKEGIVLDVRDNGGGFTHDQILNYLGAREHTVFRQRDGGEGLVLRSYDRKWTKPTVLLINNRSYSDAEIFPNAFRTLGLGKIVGQPTGGHVIGTYSVRLIDGSFFRIPRTGVFTVGGINMEKEGVKPDVVVEPHPDDLAQGKDAQIAKAVEIALQDVAVWKKNHTAVAAKPGEAKPASAATTMPIAK
jgi:tricorn protease